MTWPEVVDNGIKIGMPSLLTALVTVWVSKSSRSHELRKEFWNRRITLLQQAAEEFEATSAAMVEANGAFFLLLQNQNPSQTLMEFRGRSVEEASKALHLLQKAEAKLLLVDAREAAEALSKFRQWTQECMQVNGRLKQMPIQDVHALFARVSELREGFYAAISNRFKEPSLM